MSEEIKSHHLRALADQIKPRTLRALACDIEDCHEPQSWADYCRAAAAMLEIKDARIAELEATLAALQRDASQEIATDEMVRRLQHLGDWQAADRIDALQARVAELEGALAAAARVLHKAGEQFSEYAKQHAAKGTAVSDLKADFNKQWAERCFSAYWAANDAAEGGKDE